MKFIDKSGWDKKIYDVEAIIGKQLDQHGYGAGQLEELRYQVSALQEMMYRVVALLPEVKQIELANDLGYMEAS